MTCTEEEMFRKCERERLIIEAGKAAPYGQGFNQRLVGGGLRKWLIGKDRLYTKVQLLTLTFLKNQFPAISSLY